MRLKLVAVAVATFFVLTNVGAVAQQSPFDITLSRVQLAGPGGQALPGSDRSSPSAGSSETQSGATQASPVATVTLQQVAFAPVEGQTFSTDVIIANTRDLLGFQFDVNFDPALLAVEDIVLGPFLASTGRSAQPLGPDRRDEASGRVVYGGFTLGTPDQPGAEGGGVLATITWRVLKATEPEAAQAVRDNTGLVIPVLVVVLVLAVALYALWRISRKPGGSSAA